MGRVGNQNKKSFFSDWPSPRFLFFGCAPPPLLEYGSRLGRRPNSISVHPSVPPSPTFTPLPIGRRCTSLSNQPLPQSSLSRPPRRPIRPAREGGRVGAQSNLAISFRSSDCDGQCCKMAFRESPLHSCGRRGAKWSAEVLENILQA